MNRLITLLLLMTAPLAHAQEVCPEPTKTPRPWELTFGTTQMVIGWYEKGSLPVPTSSATVVLGYSLSESFSLWSVFNLPLSPNRRVNDEGLLKETLTPPSFMLGASYQLFKIDFSEVDIFGADSFGMDIGLSLGRTIALEGLFFPVGATRFKVILSDRSSAFIGLTTSPYNSDGEIVWGLVYGMGKRF